MNKRNVTALAIGVGTLLLMAASPKSGSEGAIVITANNERVTLQVNKADQLVQFTVVNNGRSAEWVSFECSVLGKVATCSAPSAVEVAGGGGRSVVSLKLVTTIAGPGAVTVSATGRSTGQSDAALYNVLVR